MRTITTIQSTTAAIQGAITSALVGGIRILASMPSLPRGVFGPGVRPVPAPVSCRKQLMRQALVDATWRRQTGEHRSNYARHDVFGS